MEKENQVYILTSETDWRDSDYEMVVPNAVFVERGTQIMELFIETLLKLSNNIYKWEENRKSLETRKDEIIQFLEGKRRDFIFDERLYNIRPSIYKKGRKETLDINKEDARFPIVYVEYFDEFYLENVYDEDTKITGPCCEFTWIPVIKDGTWPGLSLNFIFPFTIKDKKFYMFNKIGKFCGGPFKDVSRISGQYCFVEEESGKTYIVDLNGVKITEEGIKMVKRREENDEKYQYECVTDEDRNCFYSVINVFEKDRKYGFLSTGGIYCEAKFDDFEEYFNSDGNIPVKIGDQWGYITHEKEFFAEVQDDCKESADKKDYDVDDNELTF